MNRKKVKKQMSMLDYFPPSLAECKKMAKKEEKMEIIDETDDDFGPKLMSECHENLELYIEMNDKTIEDDIKSKPIFSKPELITLSDDDDDDDDANKMQMDKSVESKQIMISPKNNNVNVFEYLSLTLNDAENVDNYDDENQIGYDSESLYKDYKLNMFRCMIDFVLTDLQYFKLFDDFDWKIIEKFTLLSGPAQRLYVRLFIRKRDWKRKRQIVYNEIDSNLKPFLDELVNRQFLLSNSSLNSLKTALNLCDNTEIRKCAKDLKGVNLNGSSSKESLIKAIFHHVKSSRSIQSHFNFVKSESTIANNVIKSVKRIINEEVYCVNNQLASVFTRISLLAFPSVVNEDELNVSLSNQFFTLLKASTGEIKFPIYKLNKKIDIYRSRDDLIFYEEICQLESELFQLIEKNDSQAIIDKYLPKLEDLYKTKITDEMINFDRSLPSYLRSHTAGHILIRCLSHCVKILEQRKSYTEAVRIYRFLLSQDVYAVDFSGQWSERLIINLEKHLKLAKEAFSVVKQSMINANIRFGHRYSIYLRGLKMKQQASYAIKEKFDELNEYKFKCKQNEIENEILSKTVNDRKNIFILRDKTTNDVNVLSVEQVVINYYRKKDYISGVHCESLVYHSILGLLFWKVIYNDCDLLHDSFRTPYQNLPLDLNSDHFYLRRKQFFQKRFTQLHSMSKEEILNEIDMIWNENFGTLSLINWDKCKLNHLKEIVECMSTMQIIKICERLLKNFRHCRSGMPDLIVWNKEKKIIKIIEVKGPGDHLSPKQALWLNYLNEIGLDAEVCYVKARKESQF